MDEFDEIRAAQANATGAWTDNYAGRDPAVPADQLMGNPVNPRIHPSRQQKAMYAILQRIGWVSDVIVNQTTGRIIDGHMRVLIALSENRTVPVTYVNLTEQREREVIATYDQISTLAVLDQDMFEEIVESADDWGPAIEKMFEDVTPKKFDKDAAAADDGAKNDDLGDVIYGMVGWSETKVKASAEEIERLTKLHMEYRGDTGGTDEGFVTWLIQSPLA